MSGLQPREQIIIIGGGQAGGWTAKTLRDEGYSGILTVVSDEPYNFYERPPLSKQVLTDENTPLSLLFSTETVEQLNIDWRRNTKVEHILHREQQVILNNGERLNYSKLVIATGGTPRLPSHWRDFSQVLTLRSWDDAQRLRRALNTSRKIAIIGGGWIGLEIAASARKMGVQVYLFEQQSTLCARSVNQEVASVLYQLHSQHGVLIHCSCGEITLSQPDPHQIALATEKLAGQYFDFVVVGIGIELNTQLAKSADLKVEQGIVVNGRGETSIPNIFAVGDVAQHPQLGICLQSWAYAQNQAIVTARHILQKTVEHYADPAWLWSDQYDQNIQILGIPLKNRQCIVRQDQKSKVFMYLDEDNHLTQMVAFNDPRSIKIAKRWLVMNKQLDPIQLASPDVPLITIK